MSKLNDGSYKDYPDYGESRSCFKHIRENLTDKQCSDGVNVSISIDDLADLLVSFGKKAEKYTPITQTP